MTFVAVSGPLLRTVIVKVTVSPSNGVSSPELSVLVVTKSATPTAVPELPVLSVLFPGVGSVSFAETVAILSNVPGPSIVAVTVMVTSVAGEPAAILEMVHGKDVHPPPLTPVIVKLVGVSETTTSVAESVPLLDTTKV